MTLSVCRILEAGAASETPIEHKQYIDKNGQDLPEIRNWRWSSPK